jgi:hypothetical protein
MQRANARVQQSAPLEPQYDDEADYQPAPVHPLQRYGGQPGDSPVDRLTDRGRHPSVQHRC